jgi:hypothetical protein
MAVVPVTINGVAYPKNKKDPPYPVTIVGYAWITGLAPGGGPVIPPSPGGPHPSHPIALPGDPWWGDKPHPEHPIVLPPVDVAPPDVPTTPSEPKPPPPEGGWGWSPTYGWGYFPPAGSATPKRP